MDKTPPIDSIPWALLDQYQAGKTSADERARIDAILASAPGVRQALHALRQALEAAPNDVQPADVPAMFARLQTRLASGRQFKHVIRHLVDSSPERALAALMELDDAALTPEQIAQIRQLINRMKGDEL